jgi:nitrite reductase/ring-hydroxylating ferredoxin subunit
MPNPDAGNWIYAIEDAALLEGHMTAVYPKGVNVLLVRIDGVVHAVSGKCVHMACPLFTGKLEGHGHCAQFDVSNGEALSGPVPSDLGHEALPPMLGAYMGNIGMLMAHVRTESMRAYRTRLVAGWVEVDL